MIKSILINLFGKIKNNPWTTAIIFTLFCFVSIYIFFLEPPTGAQFRCPDCNEAARNALVLKTDTLPYLKEKYEHLVHDNQCYKQELQKQTEHRSIVTTITFFTFGAVIIYHLI